MANIHKYPPISVGKRFGKLVVIESLKDRPRYYHCKCDCGHHIDVRADHLRNGDTVKCHWCPKVDYSGQIINGLQIIKPMYHDKSFNWYYQIQCTCGKLFVSTIGAVKSGHTSSCGHISRSQNGLSNDPRYQNWIAMIARTTNPRHKAFNHYDELIVDGPKVYPDWINSPVGFFKELGPKPSPDYTVDRIDNHKGYVPGNIRWASHSTQQRNRDVRPGLSGHSYIYYDKRRRKWVSYGGRKDKYLGEFKTLEEAVKQRDKYNKLIGFSLNS